DRATPVTYDPTSAAFIGPSPDIGYFGTGLSVMHVPTGLFVQGHWSTIDYNKPNAVGNGYFGSGGGATQKNATHSLIQGGVGQNWVGLGNTSTYGEYGRQTDFGAASAGRTFAGTVACTTPPFTGTCFDHFTTVFGVTDTELTMWGVGINQRIDAASTDLYLGYRHFDADIKCTTTGPNCSGATSFAPGAKNSLSTEPFSAVIGGARVQF